jgi:hypothetical protein
VNLTSDQQILLAARLCQAQRNHRHHLGHDDRHGAGLEADHAQARDRRRHLALAGRAGNRRHGIEKQIKDVGLSQPESISHSWARFSCSSRRQPLHGHPRLQAADRFALHHGGAGAVRVHCGAAVRHPGAGIGRLSEDLHEADPHHAAVQYHQRTLAHAGAGRSSVRQHDERSDDRRHSADHHAVLFSRLS